MEFPLENGPHVVRSPSSSHLRKNLDKIGAVDLFLYVNLKFMVFGKKSFDVVIIHPKLK